MRTRRSDVFSISGVRIAWRRTIAQWRTIGWNRIQPKSCSSGTVPNCAWTKSPSDFQEVFRKHQTCAQHQVFIYELSAETSRPGTLKFPTIEPFLLLSPFSPRWPIPPGSSFFRGLSGRFSAVFPDAFPDVFPSLFQPLSEARSDHRSTVRPAVFPAPQSHAILRRYERRNRKRSKQQRA